MRKQILLVFSVLCSFFSVFICNAQTIKNEYFNKHFVQTTNMSKSVYLKKTTNYGDSILIIEISEKESKKLLFKEFYKNGEPFGVWLTEKHGVRYSQNYNFIINYTKDVQCERGHSDMRQITNPFEDYNTWNYKAPRKNGKLFNIHEYMDLNIVYPPLANEKGIQGKVYLSFKISKEGEISEVRVIKGANILLDKEAVRVLKMIKFDNPPSIGLIPQEFCLTIPIEFKLTQSKSRTNRFYSTDDQGATWTQ